MSETTMPADPARSGPATEQSDHQKDEPKKTLIPVPVFDSMPRKPPSFFVCDDALHATSLGLQISLHIKTRFVEELAGNGTLEQLRILSQIRGEESLTEAIDDMDFIDASELASKFFQAFHEKEEARLGESFSSSDS